MGACFKLAVFILEVGLSVLACDEPGQLRRRASEGWVAQGDSPCPGSE